MAKGWVCSKKLDSVYHFFLHHLSPSSSSHLPLSLPPPPPPSLPELSQESGIKCDDLVSTMQYYGLLKYWKGKHIVLRRKVCYSP